MNRRVVSIKGNNLTPYFFNMFTAYLSKTTNIIIQSTLQYFVPEIIHEKQYVAHNELFVEI